MIETSVILVALNEANFIVKCISSIEKQFANNKHWELILVDSGSTDKTIQLASDYLIEKKIQWRILNNKKKRMVYGWNLGIISSKGKYLIRPDAHSELSHNYILKAIEVLKNSPSDVASVGGILFTKSNNFVTDVIKNVLESYVGVGSSFRTTSHSGFVDSNVYAVYKKEIFKKVGLFDESLIRHEDNDMHSRIIKHGFKLLQNSEMKCYYYSRNSISKFLKQMLENGYYSFQKFNSLGFRHLAPISFVLGLFFGGLISYYSVFFKIIFLISVIFYFLLIFINMLYIVMSKKKLSPILSFVLIPIVHFVYGFAGIFGFINFQILKKK